MRRWRATEWMMQVRDRECLSCKHTWTAPVVLSRHTQNLSGEAKIWCPKCNSPAVMSMPVREIDELSQ